MSLAVNLDIAKRLDITCRRGNTFSLEIVMNDSLGQPIDLTNPEKYTFLMQVRPSDDSETVVIDTDPTEGFSMVGNSEGLLIITASSSTMASAGSGIFVYDLQATESSSGSVQTWFFGIFKINEDVSV